MKKNKRQALEAKKIDQMFQLPRPNTWAVSLFGVLCSVLLAVVLVMQGAVLGAVVAFVFGVILTSTHSNVARSAQLAEWMLERQLDAEFESWQAKEGREIL